MCLFQSSHLLVNRFSLKQVLRLHPGQQPQATKFQGCPSKKINNLVLVKHPTNSQVKCASKYLSNAITQLKKHINLSSCSNSKDHPLYRKALFFNKKQKQFFPKILPMDPVVLPEVRWFHPKKGQNNSLQWYHWIHLDSSSPKKLDIKTTVLGPYKTQQTRPKTPRCCWPHCRLLPQLFEEIATIGISVKQQCCFTTQKT